MLYMANDTTTPTGFPTNVVAVRCSACGGDGKVYGYGVWKTCLVCLGARFLLGRSR